MRRKFGYKFLRDCVVIELPQRRGIDGRQSPRHGVYVGVHELLPLARACLAALREVSEREVLGEEVDL